MEDEVSTLLVWNSAVCFVWILSSIEANNQSLIFWPAFVCLQRVIERLGANDKCETAFSWRVKNFLEGTLDIRCPALVEPEVGGIGVALGKLGGEISVEGEVVLRDAISKPRVSKFVDDDVYQCSVASQESYMNL